MGRKLALAACVGVVVLATATVAEAADRPLSVSELCLAAAASEERAHHIPDALLQALALAESGRRDDETGRLITWPWTVMAEGEGRFYPSKEMAVAAVKALRAKGVRNIDVGCMQINLMHHAKAFESIEKALDPATNVAYGARYLSALRRETGSWFTAVKRYHSAAPKFHLPYRTRVFQIWRNTKQQLLVAASNPAPAVADNSEAMSATISFTPGELADLPGTLSRQSRWSTAFRRTEAALAEWRQTAVHADPAAALEHQVRLAAEHAREAMAVLARSARK